MSRSMAVRCCTSTSRRRSRYAWRTRGGIRDDKRCSSGDDQTPPFHQDSPPYNRNQDSCGAGRKTFFAGDDYFRAPASTGQDDVLAGVSEQNISWIDENSHFLRGDNNYRRSGEVEMSRCASRSPFAHQVGDVRMRMQDPTSAHSYQRTPGTILVDETDGVCRSDQPG